MFAEPRYALKLNPIPANVDFFENEVVLNANQLQVRVDGNEWKFTLGSEGRLLFSCRNLRESEYKGNL